ncbi:hypothetical protein JW977_03525 [Candidatus Falkowbacteria bacterium]|nr:hypothetical protein [Candidatus Falkowbacteria bacterium]
MPSKYLKFFLLTTILFGIFLFSASLLNAYSLQNINEFTQQTQTETGLQKAEFAEVVAMVINLFLGLVGAMFVVLIIYGGFLYMTAAGTTEKVQKAKKIIIYAVIGLLIVAAAYSITYFISSAIEPETPEQDSDQIYQI